MREQVCGAAGGPCAAQVEVAGAEDVGGAQVGEHGGGGEGEGPGVVPGVGVGVHEYCDGGEVVVVVEEVC